MKSKRKPEPETIAAKPAHLTPAAGAEWDLMIPRLRDAELLSSVDLASVAAYCQAHGRWVEAETALKSHGTVIKSPTGAGIPSPYLAIANKAQDRMKKLHSIIWGGLPANIKKADQPKGLITRAQAAKELRVEPNRINKWAADGAPVAVRGSRGHSAYYDLDALKKWLSDRGRPKQDEGLSLGEARARQATAMAKKYERENRVREGQLLERATVVSEGQVVLSALKAKLLNLPRAAVLRGAVPREKEAAIRELVVEALRELARWSVGAEQVAADQVPAESAE